MTDESTAARIARGVAAFEQEDFEGALALFEAVLEREPGYPDVHNRRGLCLGMLGRREEALAAFEEAVRIAPGYAEAHLNRGILLQELGRHDAARVALDQAALLDRQGGGEIVGGVGNDIALGHARLGDLYLAAGRPERAVAEYERALEVRPGYLDIRTKLAGTLIDLGEVERALEELRRVLDRNEMFTIARLRYGVALHHAGDTEGAIEQWRRCAREVPGDLRPRAYLASVGEAPGEAPGDGTFPDDSESHPA